MISVHFPPCLRSLPAICSRLRGVVLFAMLAIAVPVFGAPVITVTKTDNTSARVSPGDTITYTITVSNTGDAPATNVEFTDAAPANTTLVANSLKISPLARDDAYNVVGNTRLEVGGNWSGSAVHYAGSVLDNDTEFFGAAMIVDEKNVVPLGNGVTTQGGVLILQTDGSFSYTPPAGFTGTDTFTYTVRNAAGLTGTATVSLHVSGRIWYVNDNGGAGDGRNGSPFQTLAAAQAASSTGDIIYVFTGNAAYSGGITLKNNQTLWGAGDALTVTLAGSGVNTGAATIRSASLAPTIVNAGGAGVTLAQGNTLHGFNVGDTATGDIVDGNGTVGNLTIFNVSLSGTGQAIDIDQGGTLNVTLASLVSTSGTNGVQLAATGAALTGTFTVTTGAISGSSGAAFLVGDGSGGLNTGGAVTISYGGTISSGANRAVDIQDRVAGAGAITFSGNITHSGSASGIFLDDNMGGAITFSGNTKTINSGTSAAVMLTDNTGATINFTNGGLAIDTTSGTGFVATGGGTVSVQGASNLITATSGTALQVANTAISASGLTFQSISSGSGSNSSATGIILDNTGASGGLRVTGLSSAGTGGTIQRKTGADGSTSTGIGIYLNNTVYVQLAWMRLYNFDNYAIRGVSVNGFTMSNCVVNTVSGINGSNLSLDEGSVVFGGRNGTVGLTGLATILNSTIANAAEDALGIYNSSGTLSLTLSNVTVTGAGNDGVSVELYGSATASVDVLNSSFSANVGDHFQAIANGSANLNVQFGSNGGNTLSAGSLTTGLGQSLGIGTGGQWSGSGTATIANNVITGAVDTPINLNIGGSGTFTANITGNTIGAEGVANSGTVANEDAIRIVANGDKSVLGDNAHGGTLTIAVTNNTIQQVDGNGIYVIARDGGSVSDPIELNLTIAGNLLRSPSPSVPAESFSNAIRIEAGASSSPTPDRVKVHANIQSNVIQGDWGPAGGDEIRLRHQFSGTSRFILTSLGANTSNTATVVSYLAGRNTLDVNRTISATINGGGSYETGGTPTQPLLLGLQADTSASPLVAAAPSEDFVSSTAPAAIDPSAGHVHDVTFTAALRSSEFAHSLTQAQLDAAVVAAAARWESTGLTIAQAALLRALSFEVADLADWHLGEASGTRIRVDVDAGGRGWFVDTAGDVAFAPISATRFHSGVGSEAAGRIDLLTAVMHEMGHALGLDDCYGLHDRDSIMFGHLAAGERRLPASGEANGAKPSLSGVTHFLSAPVSIGTLPAGKSVTITFQVAVNGSTTAGSIVNQGAVTADGGINVLTDDPDAAGATNPTVTVVEQPPTLTSVTALTGAAEDTAFSISYAALAAASNAADVNGDAIAFRIESVTSGTLTKAGNAVVPGATMLAIGESLVWTGAENASGTLAAFTVRASDGIAVSASAVQVSVTVSPVGDEPEISATTTAEDTLSSSGLVVSRNAADDSEITHFKITNIANGTLFQSDGTTSIADGAFITAAQASAGLRFLPAADKNTNAGDTFSFDVAGATDGSGAGLGAGKSASVTVTEVNDAPVPVDDALDAVDEDSSARTITFAALTANDSTGPNNESGQSLTIVGVANAVGGTVEIDGANVIFTPEPNFAGTASFDYTVEDNGVTDGEADPKSADGSASFTVNAVNDAPTLTAPPTLIGAPNVPVTIIGLSVADIDAGSSSVTLTLSAGEGTFAASSSGGATVSGGNTATLTLSGAIDDLNTFLDGGNVTYTSAADATLSVTVNDNGNTGSGGSKSANASIAVTLDRAPVAGFGGALALESSRSEGVQVAHNAALNFGTGSFTIEAWFKRASSVNGFYTLVGKQADAGGTGFYLRFNTHKLSFAVGTSSSANSVDGNLSITDNTWHHVAAVVDASASTMSLYVDGVLDHSSAFALARTVDSGAALGLGFKPGYGEHFDGVIDDVRLWSTARTAAEIREFMRTPLSGAETGLVGYWTFEGTSATVENYTTAPGLDGTVQGAGGAAERVSGNIEYTVVLAEDSGANTLRLGGNDFENNATTFARITGLPANGKLYHADGTTEITGASAGSPVTVVDAAGSPRRVVYVPNADFNGSDSFTYIVNDGGANSANTATVSLTITSENDAPTATNLTQSKTATEGGAAVALDDIVVSDADAGETISATLTFNRSDVGTLSTGTFGSATSTYHAGTGVWTVTGSVADVNAALAAVSLTPSADNDQNFTITTRVRDAANTGPADGTISFTVTGVNDAPTATHLTQTQAATEGGSMVALDDIVVADVDTGETITAALTLSNTSAGTLSTGTFGSATSTYNAGTGVWTVTGSVADVNAALAAVAFTPSANNDQNFTITTRVRDAANTGPADGTISFTVTPVNDAPTATNLTQSKTATEGGSAVGLDDIVVTDVDTGETITATLTSSRTSAGTLSTGTFGSATSTYNAGTGVWTVTGSVADVNAALAAVAFTPSANNDQNFTIATRIRDAANTGPADGTISFTVTGVNDAPTATNLTQTQAATEGGNAVALDDIVVADVDTGETITAALTLSNTSAGTLSTGTFGSATSTYNAGTGVWTVTGSVADVNAALAAVALTPSANNDQNFTITTRVRDAANTGPADGAISFTVTPENDAPTATNLTQSKSATEEGSVVALDDIVVTDPDTGDSITATLTLSDAAAGTLSTGTYGSATSTFNAGTGVWRVTGSVADVNAALAAVAFTPSADNDQSFTIATRVRDAANTGPADGTIAFTVTAVNDASVVISSGGTTAYTEDGAAVVIDPGLTVSDIDNLTLEGAAVSITANFQSGEDVLGFANQNGIVGAYNSGSGVLTLSGTATVAHYQAALRSVSYSNTSDTPNTANRTVRFVVNDGELDSLPATKTLSVTAANDPAVVTTSSGLTAFIEGNNVLSTPVAVDPQLTVSDADSATLASATISITANLQSSEDRLAFANDDTTAYGNIGGSYDNLTGVLSLSSGGATATVAQWQNALRAVTYRNISQTPNEATRTITFVVNDGADSSLAATKDVSVTAVNDTPTLTVSATASYTENAAATSILTGGQNSLGDADHANLVGATAVLSGGFTDDGDALAADTSGTAITATWDASSHTLTLVGSDSKAHYGTVLGRVTFRSTNDNPTNFGANPTRTITWQINDGAQENNLSVAQTTTLTITAVNDAPTIAGTIASQVVTDKTTLTPFSSVTIADVDDASVAASVSLDAAAKGALSNLGGGSYDSNTGVYTIVGTPTAVTTALRALIFTPAENRVVPGGTETTTFTIEVDDGEATPATNNATTAISTSVNDAPVNIALSVAAVSHSAGANAIVGTLTTSDVDTGDSFTYTLAAGSGSEDNASFNISGDKLRVTAPASLAAGSYSVRVQTKDAGDAAFEKAFTISVSDDVAATIQSITGPAASTYGIGEALEFTVVFSEPVLVDATGGIPALTLTIGGVTRSAVYVSGSGTTTLVFRYVVEAGDHADSGEVELLQLDLNGGTIKDASGNNASLTFTSPTLDGVQVEASFHSADTDQNWRLSLLELTRVIELYNTRDGTTRTGAYHTDATTEDGFAAGPGTIASHHSADTNQDGRLSLLELTRVIELYNTRDGTTRTGEYYRTDTGTEDGFAPGVPITR